MGGASRSLSHGTTITNKQFLALAIPLILSTITTPLLGAVDTAVVGQLPDPVLIGGVAVGSMIFNTLYWVLGFLRVSTSGFTAQAHGAKSEPGLFYAFLRPVLVAMLFGILFIVLQEPIKWAAISVIKPTEAVAEQVIFYFDIRIWGAPFTLLNYVILGWLIGSSKIKLSLFLQAGMNITNIILDILFVHSFHMGVEGVAAATLISEVTFAILGVFLLFKLNLVYRPKIQMSDLFEKEVFMKMVQVNRDLFIRTVCLLTVFTMFTSQGAQMGEIALAANAILFQIHYIMAYCVDGFANASSIFVGRSVGSKNKSMYDTTLKLSGRWGIVLVLGLTVVFYLAFPVIIRLFTAIPEVSELAFVYMGWVLLYPVLGVWGLQLNGVFSGATEASQVRNSLIVAMIVFLIAVYIFVPTYQNHGLWFAFSLFTLMRTLVLWYYLPGLGRKLFPIEQASKKIAPLSR